MNAYMSKIFLEILDYNRQQVLRTLSNFRDEGYLAGGTALALQLGHRTSYDFDIFMDHPVTKKLKDKIKKKFGKVIYKWNTDEQITLNIIENNIGITFVEQDFKPAFPLIETPHLALASVEDIAADKAYTIGRRAVWRDYVDIFVILKKKIATLQNIINFAAKKCEGMFVEIQFLEQLVYFEDIEQTPIEFIGENYSYEQITSGLKQEVEEYLQSRNKA